MLKRSKQLRPGFTIVELLIVIVVIAILAAISIVAYRGIQDRAYDTTVQSDLRQSFARIQQFNIENGKVPTTWSEINQTFVTTRSAYGGTGFLNFLTYCRTDTAYAVVGRSKGGTSFAYSTNDGAMQVDWSDTNTALCPRAGISTSEPGYSNTWIGVNGGWTGSYTVGQ